MNAFKLSRLVFFSRKFVWATVLLICPLPMLAITNSIFITSFARTGLLTWTNATPVAFPVTMTNSVYQIVTATNLTGSWQIVPGFNAIRPSNTLASVLISPLNADKQFYRVGVTNPVLADSIADFSGTQGKNNWHYGYYSAETAPFTTADFQYMTNYSAGTWYVLNGTYWTRLWDKGGHPNGFNTTGGRQQINQWAVRRWISTTTGAIHVYGTVHDTNPGNGNGVICHIKTNSGEVAAYTIDDGGTTNFAITISVTLGAPVDFAIDPRNSSDVEDNTDFYFTIQQ